MAEAAKTGTRPYTVLEATSLEALAGPDATLNEARAQGKRIWIEHSPVEAATKKAAIKKVLADVGPDAAVTAEAVAGFKPVTRKVETKTVDRWTDA